MALYAKPWHYILNHGNICYTMASLFVKPFHYLLNHSFICHNMDVSAKPACLLNRGNLVIIAHAHEQSAVSDQVARVVPPASSRD